MNQLKTLKLPDYITLLGLLSVILSTLAAYFGYFLLAYFLILGQIIADYFDGKLARKIKRQNELGVHLDNFSDFYTIINDVLLGIFIGISHYAMFIIFPLFIAAGAVRLGYFTIRKNTEQNIYTGLPTTACSFIISTLIILNYLTNFAPMNYLLVFFLALAYLMVSNFKFQKW